MDISLETFQAVIDDWGLNAVLKELDGFGLEHVGLTIHTDGVLAKLADR